MKKVEWAYVAGLFDGEGCVSATHPSSSRWYVRVQITQKDPQVLEWVNVRWLGYLRHQVKNNFQVDRAGVWEWRLFAQDRVEDFLLGILPYAVVKHRQTRVALAIIDSSVGARQNLLAKRLKELKHV